VETTSPLANDREISVEVEVDTEAHQAVLLDRERIWQVLANLIGNALKFTPSGGRVTVNARKVGDKLSISVADTGVGIAPAELPHVFDRYYTSSQGQRGTGLGLYIAKGLVEAHGGSIWLESQVGVGTIVYVTLPVQLEGCVHSSAPTATAATDG
jgi:signal transduction histidine kinase